MHNVVGIATHCTLANIYIKVPAAPPALTKVPTASAPIKVLAAPRGTCQEVVNV